MEKHVLLKKLRDALESLKGRVAGRNKDDVEDAISMVSCSFASFFNFLIIVPFSKHILLFSVNWLIVYFI